MHFSQIHYCETAKTGDVATKLLWLWIHMRGAAWRHFFAAKSVRYVGGNNGEGIPYEQRETRVYRLFCELLLFLKDMAPNYSKLAQAALFVHEELLTVILTLPPLEEGV